MISACDEDTRCYPPEEPHRWRHPSEIPPGGIYTSGMASPRSTVPELGEPWDSLSGRQDRVAHSGEPSPHQVQQLLKIMAAKGLSIRATSRGVGKPEKWLGDRVSCGRRWNYSYSMVLRWVEAQ